MSRMHQRPLVALTLLAWVAGCTSDTLAIFPTADSSADETGDEDEGEDEGEDEDTGEAGESFGDPEDLPDDPEPMQVPSCALAAEGAGLDGRLPCELEAPAETIEPYVAWTWTGHGNDTSVLVTPLVANLDDDNGDGFVDLCDTPDVVVAAVDLPPGKTDPWPAGHLYILDGQGQGQRRISTAIDAAINPALGDLDGDGVAEIVVAQAQGPSSPYHFSERRLLALRPDGELLWAGDTWLEGRGGGAIAIADLDGDGAPEVLGPEHVANRHGELLWAPDDPPTAFSMPVAVDLDLDGSLEVMFGASAYTHDGEHLFDTPTVPRNRGSVAIANFDDDPAPEYYAQFDGQHGVFEHDGSFKTACPTGNLDIAGAGGYPVSIQDLDQDGDAELLFGYEDKLYVLAVENDDCFVKWSRKVDQSDGLSSGTMFDLLGDGKAEAIYADRSRLKLYSDTGTLLFQTEHNARESIANPVVADVDGDGAAEILVVSSEPTGEVDEPSSPTLMVIDNGSGRFNTTRRVWNQHTFHHSNISELGDVPAHQEPQWSLDDGFNGFRANLARGEDPDAACIPPWLAP